MKTVCMYCNATLRETRRQPEATSHGCCVGCLDRLFEPPYTIAYRRIAPRYGDVARRVEVLLARDSDPDRDDIVMTGWLVQPS